VAKALHKESNLPRRLIGRAFQNLCREVGSKRHKLACDEAVAVLITKRAQGRSFEQGSQVKCGQGIKYDDFMGSIGVDG